MVEVRTCPDCGNDSLTVYHWDDGTVTKGCRSCDNFEYQPPAPEVKQ